MRDYRFTFLCNEEEKWLISKIAERLQRSQGDALRFLLRQKAKELGIIVKHKKGNSEAQLAT